MSEILDEKDKKVMLNYREKLISLVEIKKKTSDLNGYDCNDQILLLILLKMIILMIKTIMIMSSAILYIECTM